MNAAIDSAGDGDWLEETAEWLESLDDVIRTHGVDRTRELLARLQHQARQHGIDTDGPWFNTPYRNTIPLDRQPAYPGDIDLETRIENIIRWNAMAMVLRANDRGTGVGGHIATYASAATLLEVGFNHFFRARSATYGGDMVTVQAHAAPGVYARAFLEGRLTRRQLENFRRELQDGGGLSSYPHPCRMPDFWQQPSASMGLSTASSIYQARFAKYLQNRGLKPDNGGKVWTFIGDGEADEPEVLGTMAVAARERLDNLVLVVNCNLQRLDGPVRGNGKIIQELERGYRGAGWHVIKVIWGSEWDPLLQRDHDGALQARMDAVRDGDYQLYSVSSGAEVRAHWVNGNPALETLMRPLTDEEVRCIKRGGHDHKKIYAAFAEALSVTGKPTVILAKTIKGYGMGQGAEGRNTAHQKKQMSDAERLACARTMGIPLDDDAVAAAEFYRPEADSPELQYLQRQRDRLNGYLPSRDDRFKALPAPQAASFQGLLEGGGSHASSTTMALIRLLARLLKDEHIGRYIVPIVPDEARTFGMDTLFRNAGIYSPEGQLYQPVDAGSLLYYKEARDGQILQEGICETGAMASFMAAGTAYAHHGVPTIPFYVFYSMFGFQRVGDMIWACGDMMCKGFLLGGTSGRTTLNGEGVQHQDGHSHILASTVPNLISYDPAFAYELAVVVRDGIRRMYRQGENIFYYLTVYNETYPMPAMPDGVEERILRGLYCFRRATRHDNKAHAHLLGSGALMGETLRAQALLQTAGISADVWSVTSYNELQRDALRTEQYNRDHPDAAPQRPYLCHALAEESGVFIAASDYMKALPQTIASWMPCPYRVLGTDGYGLSESRAALRAHFQVDARHIALAAIHLLAQQQLLAPGAAQRARRSINEDEKAA